MKGLERPLATLCRRPKDRAVTVAARDPNRVRCRRGRIGCGPCWCECRASAACGRFRLCANDGRPGATGDRKAPGSAKLSAAPSGSRRSAAHRERCLHRAQIEVAGAMCAATPGSGSCTRRHTWSGPRPRTAGRRAPQGHVVQPRRHRSRLKGRGWCRPSAAAGPRGCRREDLLARHSRSGKTFRQNHSGSDVAPGTPDSSVSEIRVRPYAARRSRSASAIWLGDPKSR